MTRLVLCLCLVACTTTKPAPPKAYPGTLVRPDQISADFLARQHVSGQYGDKEMAFDAVLQKQGDRLVLLGLAPFGAKAFAIEQRGDEVTFHQYLPFEMPFEPRFILLDVDRASFIGVPGAPHADGTHTTERDGERITEVWKDGTLSTRTFTRLDANPPGEIVVTYSGWAPDRLLPERMQLANGWFGYTLEITTTDEQPLGQP